MVLPEHSAGWHIDKLEKDEMQCPWKITGTHCSSTLHQYVSLHPKAIINLTTSAVCNNMASKISSKFGMVNYDNMDPLFFYFQCLFPYFLHDVLALIKTLASGNLQEMEKL